MLTLSPAKILVVLVIGLIVLGPDKLPGLARQMGAAWGDLRRFRARLESEVRDVFPDLPPAHEVAQAVRSPLAFLDRLADEHERTQEDGPVTVVEPVEVASADSAAPPPGSGRSTAHSSTAQSNGSHAMEAPSNGAESNGAGAHVPPAEAVGRRAAPDPPPAPLDDPSMN